MPKGKWIAYSAAELEWLEANCLLVVSDYARQFNERFGREVTPGALHALRRRKGWKTGRTGCFERGNKPHNKGRPFPVATTHPNCRKTQFKKGRLPHNTQYLGHERVDPKDGYVYVSVDEPNPHTGFERRYVLKHVRLWEKANGPVPAGHCLKCLDGDRTNCDPSNWECIPRALLPRLAGGNRYHKVLAYDDAAPEVRPALLTMAKIEHAARKRRRA